MRLSSIPIIEFQGLEKQIVMQNDYRKRKSDLINPRDKVLWAPKFALFPSAKHRSQLDHRTTYDCYQGGYSEKSIASTALQEIWIWHLEGKKLK